MAERINSYRELRVYKAETEACESQVWLEISLLCGYISKELFEKLEKEYENIIGQIVKMINDADKWLIK